MFKISIQIFIGIVFRRVWRQIEYFNFLMVLSKPISYSYAVVNLMIIQDQEHLSSTSLINLDMNLINTGEVMFSRYSMNRTLPRLVIEEIMLILLFFALKTHDRRLSFGRKTAVPYMHPVFDSLFHRPSEFQPFPASLCLAISGYSLLKPLFQFSQDPVRRLVLQAFAG